MGGPSESGSQAARPDAASVAPSARARSLRMRTVTGSSPSGRKPSSDTDSRWDRGGGMALTRAEWEQSPLSHRPVTGAPDDRSMSCWPHCGTAMVVGWHHRPFLHLSDHAFDLLIQRDAAVQSGHNGAAHRRAHGPKVTRSSRSGSMFITERGRGLTRHVMARKSHHADAHTWRRVFAAARHPIRANVAGESMHGTADRLPAARTWVWSAGAQCSGTTPTAALRLGGQEGAGRTW